MTRQTFKTVNVLRLEVEDTPTGLINLLRNADGDYGSWGWVTPVASTLLERVTGIGGSNPYNNFFKFTVNPSVDNYFYSEPANVAAGDYVAAAWYGAAMPSEAGSYVRASIEYLDSTLAVIGTSGLGLYKAPGPASSGGTYADRPQTQAPAGTAKARLRFDVYANTGGSKPTQAFLFKQPVLLKSPSVGGIGAPIYRPNATYTDVLGSAHSISVKRDELNLGTLTADILNATLDPSQSTLIRPGKRVRLMALDNATATWSPLFVGTVLKGTTVYDPKRTDVKRARITLTAVDAIAQLASSVRTKGVGTVDELKAVLEGASVPWAINGSGNQIASATYLTDVKGATALDQIAVTRDTALGYAWVSRKGVVTVWDRASIPTTVAATLNETKYSDLNIDYDTDRCINTVNVKLRRNNLATGETVEVAYGPYVDQASIDQWGAHEATFTINGGGAIADTPAAVSAYAAPILTANATPAVRVNAVSLPIRDAADVVTGKALLDLFDLVTVVNANASINTNMRITGLEHKITDGKWMLDLAFTVTGSVSPPQSVPSGGVVAVPTSGEGVWTALPYAAGWADYGGGHPAGQYMRLNGFLYIRGLIKRTGANAAIATPIFTLPVGFRPPAIAGLPAVGSTAAVTEILATFLLAATGVGNCSIPINTNGYIYVNFPPIALA